jgi:hypothetical protein
MSLLSIPPRRVQLYRVLWSRWIIVLRILFDLGAGAHPVKWQAVSDVLMIDKKTSQKYLSGLVRDGHLAIAGNGYMLTDAGMAFLRETNEGEFLPLGGKIPGEIFSPLKELVVVNDSELNQLTTPPTESGKNPGEIFSPLAKLIFEHIPDIFDGSQLVTTRLPWKQDAFQDTLLLGWVAYAYDKRTSLSSPVGLIYRKLQSDERPSVKYLECPARYLPESFLINIGLVQQEPDVVEEAVELEPVRELSEAENLLQELSERSTDIAAVCITWSALSYIDGVLTLGVRDEQKRALWSKRMGAKASALLAEITETDARVEFVVSVETEVE